MGAAAPSAHAQTGGTTPSLAPRVLGFECVAACTGLDSVRSGGTVRVHGANFTGASAVTFLGGAGKRDDVVVEPRGVRDDRLDVRVPAKAVTGPIAVFNASGQASKPSSGSLGVFRGRAVRDFKSTGSSVDAGLVAKRVFFAGRQKAVLRYVVLGSAKPVRIDLVARKTNDVVARWTPGTVEANQTKTVVWSGLSHGRLSAEGAYQFRLFTGQAAKVDSSGQAVAAQSEPAVADSFTFLRHQFPIRGAHNYGGGTAGIFGAGRGDHSHQGQDVFARCGTPLVAARGGTVQHKAIHSAAGNYLVIDGAETGIDYAYMHMVAPAVVAKGERVFTGQLIGYVGDTGRATGCHLHFEMWNAPGWYEGGAPFDPLPALREWDRSS